MAVTLVTISGSVVDPEGVGIVRGTITCQLSTSGSTLDGAASVRVCGEASGAITAGVLSSLSLVPNDAITPSGTYYLAIIEGNLSNGRRYRKAEKWQLTSADLTLDIGAVPRLDAVPGLNIAPFYISGDATAMQAKATGAAAFRTIADHLAAITPPVDGDPMPITKADGSTGIGSLSSSDTFAGYAGTALTGAPRLRLGTNTPMGVMPSGDADDAALLILRALTGDSLFSHAVRDESTFDTTTTGAYASFDAIPRVEGSTHYNHLHAFQARPQYLASGIIDAIADFVADLLADAGTVSARYGLKVNDATGSGTITNQYGIWISPLTKGGGNFGIYVAANPSYLGGNLQIAGTFTGATTGTFSSQVNAAALNATADAVVYSSGGGAILGGGAGGSIATLLAYSNAGGTEKKIRINPAAVGFVGIGVADPAYLLHVGGAAGINGGLTMSGALDGATTGSFSSQVNVVSLNATGNAVVYAPAGGVNLAGGLAGAATLLAYSAPGTEKKLRINPAGVGFVGIGISDPAYLLHVGGGAGINGALVMSGALSGVTSITATGEAKVSGFNATGTPAAFSASGGVGVWGFEGNSYAVVRAYSNAGGTEKVLALNDGGVGGVCIGTTSSTHKITKSLRATATLGTGAITAGTTASQTITVTGAVTGAEVSVGGPATLEAGLMLFGHVSAADTVTLRVANVSAGSITPAGSQTVSVRVFNP